MGSPRVFDVSMAHQFQITPDGTLLELWHGPVTPDEWIQHESALLGRPDLHYPRQTVCDVSHAVLGAFDATAVERCLSLYEHYRDRMRGSRVAVVCRRGFAGNEFYVELARQFGMTVITFYNRFPSACRWIGVDQATARIWRRQALEPFTHPTAGHMVQR